MDTARRLIRSSQRRSAQTHDAIKGSARAKMQVRLMVELQRGHAHEHCLAEVLQHLLLLSAPTVNFSDLCVAGISETASPDVPFGGDFYDVFPLDSENVALVLGDVCGKGLRRPSCAGNQVLAADAPPRVCVARARHDTLERSAMYQARLRGELRPSPRSRFHCRSQPRYWCWRLLRRRSRPAADLRAEGSLHRAACRRIDAWGLRGASIHPLPISFGDR